MRKASDWLRLKYQPTPNQHTNKKKTKIIIAKNTLENIHTTDIFSPLSLTPAQEPTELKQKVGHLFFRPSFTVIYGLSSSSYSTLCPWVGLAQSHLSRPCPQRRALPHPCQNYVNLLCGNPASPVPHANYIGAVDGEHLSPRDCIKLLNHFISWSKWFFSLYTTISLFYCSWR